jgi:hypothetical protein
MVTKPIIAYKPTRVSYIMNIVCLLHFSAIIVAILGKVKDTLRKFLNQCSNTGCKVLKICGLKYILKYKRQIIFHY